MGEYACPHKATVVTMATYQTYYVNKMMGHSVLHFVCKKFSLVLDRSTVNSGYHGNISDGTRLNQFHNSVFQQSVVDTMTGKCRAIYSGLYGDGILCHRTI